jgi:CRISPR-associated endonuclease/helicase Cas3
VPTARDLWAKLARDGENRITGWHSLVHHSADVAAVLLALLDQPTIAARLAHLAGRDALDAVTRVRLGALAFLHDVGKANRGFRARVDPCALPVGHIDQVAWLFHTDAGVPHGERVNAVLGMGRSEGWFASDGALQAFDAVFAHHGRPWQRAAPPESSIHWRRGPDGDPVGDLAEMREALDQWFPSAFGDGPPMPDTSAFYHAYAGLLMLADWLGSDTAEGFFPFANGGGPDRMIEAKRRACWAVRTVGLESAPPEARRRVAKLGFAAAFAVAEPRPVQAAAILPEAGCVVLEAETGSGKTEAALWRFKRLFEQGAVDGLYFALPTRVAATAMFERVKAFRDRVFGGPPPVVVLAVPGQAMVDEAEGHPLPGFGFEWDDAPDGGASRTRWAAEHPKRFLAAPIAVGTVDQALLGAIRVKHAHMRA